MFVWARMLLCFELDFVGVAEGGKFGFRVRKLGIRLCVSVLFYLCQCFC